MLAQRITIMSTSKKTELKTELKKRLYYSRSGKKTGCLRFSVSYDIVCEQHTYQL